MTCCESMKASRVALCNQVAPTIIQTALHRSLPCRFRMRQRMSSRSPRLQKKQNRVAPPLRQLMRAQTNPLRTRGCLLCKGRRNRGQSVRTASRSAAGKGFENFTAGGLGHDLRRRRGVNNATVRVACTTRRQASLWRVVSDSGTSCLRLGRTCGGASGSRTTAGSRTNQRAARANRAETLNRNRRESVWKSQ